MFASLFEENTAPIGERPTHAEFSSAANPFPTRLGFGRNTASFEMVARTENRLVAGGGVTLPSAAAAAH